MSQRHFRVHPDVLDTDLKDALRYYGDLDGSLASRLTESFIEALHHIESHPLASREYISDYRRIVLIPFPYMLVYAVDPESVYVVALLHNQRNPEANESLIAARS